MSPPALFGGHGIYWNDVIFGILFRGGSTSRWTIDAGRTTCVQGNGAVPTERASDLEIRITRCHQTYWLIRSRCYLGPGKRSGPDRSRYKRRETRS